MQRADCNHYSLTTLSAARTVDSIFALAFVNTGQLPPGMTMFPSTLTLRRHHRSTVTLQVEQLEDRLTPDAVSTASITFNNVTASPVITNAYVLDLFNDVLFRSPTAVELPIQSPQLR